jgi:hypothetical protein
MREVSFSLTEAFEGLVISSAVFHVSVPVLNIAQFWQYGKGNVMKFHAFCRIMHILWSFRQALGKGIVIANKPTRSTR